MKTLNEELEVVGRLAIIGLFSDDNLMDLSAKLLLYQRIPIVILAPNRGTPDKGLS